MTQYRMRTPDDCGPAAISAVTGIEYERILEAWPGGWGDTDRGLLGLPNDTPSDHFGCLDRLGVPYRIVTCGEILSCPIPENKIIVLLHGDSFAAQHWVVIAERSPDGVRVHWGDGTMKNFKVAEFQNAYSAGWPACAYLVGETGKISWWQRLLNWIARWI